MNRHVRSTPLLLGLLVALPASRPAPAAPQQTAVLAGGCFWGVEAVFEHLRGVKSVTSGYAVPLVQGDTPDLAHRGVAEAVRIVYDPAQISYAQLLQVFFLVAHDPTEVDRQGPDEGTRYRSIVFAATDDERRVTRSLLDSLRASRTYAAPIVTEILALKSFQTAEDFHQNYVVRNPTSGYVVVNDLPKLAELRRRFPTWYRS